MRRLGTAGTSSTWPGPHRGCANVAGWRAEEEPGLDRLRQHPLCWRPVFSWTTPRRRAGAATGEGRTRSTWPVPRGPPPTQPGGDRTALGIQRGWSRSSQRSVGSSGGSGATRRRASAKATHGVALAARPWASSTSSTSTGRQSGQARFSSNGLEVTWSWLALEVAFESGEPRFAGLETAALFSLGRTVGGGRGSAMVSL